MTLMLIVFTMKKILKINDFIALKNVLFVKDSLQGNTPASLQNNFRLTREIHNHGTRNARNNLVDIPQVRTQTYGHFSIYKISLC